MNGGRAPSAGVAAVLRLARIGSSAGVTGAVGDRAAIRPRRLGRETARRTSESDFTLSRPNEAPALMRASLSCVTLHRDLTRRRPTLSERYDANRRSTRSRLSAAFGIAVS